MATKIDIRDLYLSIVNSMDEANSQVALQDQDADREYTYAITDLEFSIPFRELDIDNKGQVGIGLADPNDSPNANRNLRFKVRYVPKPPKVEPEPEPEPERVTMPDLVKKNAEEAMKIIQAAKLLLGNVQYQPMEKPFGIVLAQAPKVGSQLSVGEKVSLVISGPGPGTVIRDEVKPKEKKTVKAPTEKKTPQRKTSRRKKKE